MVIAILLPKFDQPCAKRLASEDLGRSIFCRLRHTVVIGVCQDGRTTTPPSSVAQTFEADTFKYLLRKVSPMVDWHIEFRCLTFCASSWPDSDSQTLNQLAGCDILYFC